VHAALIAAGIEEQHHWAVLEHRREGTFVPVLIRQGEVVGEVVLLHAIRLGV
jgi:hypothetical protein